MSVHFGSMRAAGGSGGDDLLVRALKGDVSVSEALENLEDCGVGEEVVRLIGIDSGSKSGRGRTAGVSDLAKRALKKVSGNGRKMRAVLVALLACGALSASEAGKVLSPSDLRGMDAGDIAEALVFGGKKIGDEAKRDTSTPQQKRMDRAWKRYRELQQAVRRNARRIDALSDDEGKAPVASGGGTVMMDDEGAMEGGGLFYSCFAFEGKRMHRIGVFIRINSMNKLETDRISLDSSPKTTAKRFVAGLERKAMKYNGDKSGRYEMLMKAVDEIRDDLESDLKVKWKYREIERIQKDVQDKVEFDVSEAIAAPGIGVPALPIC